MSKNERIVISCSDDELISWQVECKEILDNTELIVAQGCSAVFMYKGEVLEQFIAGTHVLNERKQGWLSKLFKKRNEMEDCTLYGFRSDELIQKWGVGEIAYKDSRYDISVMARGFGELRFKIQNPVMFLKKMSGNTKTVTKDNLKAITKADISMTIKNALASKLIGENTSYLEINSKLIELAEKAKDDITERLIGYGIMVKQFSIDTISFPDEIFEEISKAERDLKMAELDKQRRAQLTDEEKKIIDGGIETDKIKAGGAQQEGSHDEAAFCSKCGSKIKGDDIFCAKCGKRVRG